MASRKPTGQLYENRSKRTGKVTSYGIRFRYGGKRHYVTLDATTRKQAETAAGHLLADVQRGLWTPPEERAPEREPREMPTFAEFASDWYRALVYAKAMSSKDGERERLRALVDGRDPVTADVAQEPAAV